MFHHQPGGSAKWMGQSQGLVTFNRTDEFGLRFYDPSYPFHGSLAEIVRWNLSRTAEQREVDQDLHRLHERWLALRELAHLHSHPRVAIRSNLKFPLAWRMIRSL